MVIKGSWHFVLRKMAKIGFRFDGTIPRLSALGGLCEENHGFFCAGNYFLTGCLLII